MGRTQKMMPMLSVADLAAAVAFYGVVLEGEQTYRFPPDGEPAFVVFRLGESEIGLGLIGASTPLHDRPLRPATGHRIELCVDVDDVDATVSAMRAAGVPVVVEPIDMPWGERVAYVEDPDGSLVMLTA
jgi:lactoylglutathione lyase